MVKFVINCMLNIQTQHKLLFNFKIIYSIQVLGPSGNRPFFSSVVGQRKGLSEANAPPVHGIKKCLECKSKYSF
jgi:hypothetical protein